jgi:hypothetical protein
MLCINHCSDKPAQPRGVFDQGSGDEIHEAYGNEDQNGEEKCTKIWLLQHQGKVDICDVVQGHELQPTLMLCCFVLSFFGKKTEIYRHYALELLENCDGYPRISSGPRTKINKSKIEPKSMGSSEIGDPQMAISRENDG